MNHLAFFQNLKENRYSKFKIFNCKKCSINLSFINTETTCPYCLNKIDSFELKQIIKYDYVLPIKIKKEESIELLSKWLNKDFFINRSLKKYINEQNIKCIYTPYWLFNIKTNSTYKIKKSKNQNLNQIIQKIFNDLIIKADNYEILESIKKFEVWNILDLKEFDLSFIDKSIIEIYNIEPQEAFKSINADINYDIKILIENDSISTQKIDNIKTNYENIDFTQLLIPTWIINYYHKDKNYIYLINAQTGDILGNKIYNKLNIYFILITIVLILFTILLSVFT